MTGKKKNITTRFQYQWVLQFAALSVVSSGLLVLTLKRFFDLELSGNYGQAFSTLRNLEDLLLPIIGFSVLFYTTMVCILAAVIILYLSRSVAAPIFRIEEVARRISRRDLSFSAEHHRREQLQDLVAVTEDLRKQFETQMQSLSPHLEAVDRSWKEIDDAPPERHVQTALQELERIKDELEAIGHRLSS